MNKQEAIRAIFNKVSDINITAPFEGNSRWILHIYGDNLNKFQYGKINKHDRPCCGHFKTWWHSGQINADIVYDEDGRVLSKKVWNPNGNLITSK